MAHNYKKKLYFMLINSDVTCRKKHQKSVFNSVRALSNHICTSDFGQSIFEFNNF